MRALERTLGADIDAHEPPPLASDEDGHLPRGHGSLGFEGVARRVLELTDGSGDLPSIAHDVDPPLEIGEVRMQVVLRVLEDRPDVRSVPLAPEIHPEPTVRAPQVLEHVATIDAQREAHGRKRRIQLGLPVATGQTAEEAGDGCDRAAPVRLGPAHG